VERLLGGASRETWALVADGRPLVLRRDPPGAPRSGAMRREAALMSAARAAGVAVPEVIAAGDDYVLMARLSGETLARRILRDETYDAARAALTAQCATALARLHTQVDPAAVPDLPRDADPVAALREHLDQVGEPHPVLELGLARLAASRPPERHPAVVHGDFRLGNLMVDADGLVGILDWELAHLGDPAEDLGWLCVRSWRFGGAAPVAGVGTRSALLASYAEAGGSPVSPAALDWWELYGTVRWGVICGQQASAHLSGAVRSVELAAVGRRAAEVELDVLELLAPDVVRATLDRASPLPVTTSARLHDRPRAAELVEAVAEWVDGLALDGHPAFEARVVRRMLAIAGREIEFGPALDLRHAERLTVLGVTDDVALAADVRAGRDGPELVAALAAAVADKLRVADPAQLRR
jgi:aminoglycoside phosphotransferase (APT) family kinase protein